MDQMLGITFLGMRDYFESLGQDDFIHIYQSLYILQSKHFDPPSWPRKILQKRLKKNFMDLKELGEYLEEMEHNLIGVMALKDYYLNWKDSKKVQQ